MVGLFERCPGQLLVLAGALAVALAVAAWLHWRLRAARRDLDRACRAKTEFVTNVSHELRTPLNGIQGMAQLLAREVPTPDLRQMATAIQGSCESLMAVVDRIIDYARIERGELEIRQGPLDVRDLVAEAAAATAPEAKAKGLAFETSVEPAVPRLVLGDPLRLREVLHYLLDNAVKFTAAGAVRLEVTVAGDRRQCHALLFRVCDTGPGIEPDVARRLFTAFTQADGTNTRAYGGLGLGLALAHRLVGLMGGSIDVESCPGCGSVFWFLLPATVVEPNPAGTPEPAQCLPERNRRVLVVDDNPINQLVAVRAIHSLGYAADAVSSGEAALQALARARYHAVLMDCQMPGMDGFETASRIRRLEASTVERTRLPIIAMTANGPGADRERCLAAGMDDYLTKPFRIASLQQALEPWLAAGGAVEKTAS